MSDRQHIDQLLGQGEGLSVEFKESHSDLPKSLFETICAFLNREGGTILLGVRDDGTILGVDPSVVSRLCQELVTSANNPEKLSPVCMLFPEAVEVDGKTIIYLPVPQSSQVHRTKGHPYDRSADGDFRLLDADAVRLLYLRKSAYYSENQVFPYLRLEDLKAESIQHARALTAAYRDRRHPWLGMSDEEMLRSAGLWQRDPQTGREGYTLAAALLFGSEQTLLSTVPQYFIDALLRRVDQDRYDDRDYIRANLLEAYDRLMTFVAKHLPDPFYLEGDQRISIRGVIFREVVANLLVHREYTSGFTARMIIYRDRVTLENPNRAAYQGPIDPQNFVPRTKNPTLANFFKEIGLMDQLGSGVRNVTRYAGIYSGGQQAEFLEGDIFRTVIPLDERIYTPSTLQPGENADDDAVNDAVNDAVKGRGEAVKGRIRQELLYLTQRNGISLAELKEMFGISRETAQRDMSLLKRAGLVLFTGSPKTGQYRLTNEGKKKLHSP